MYYNKFGSVSPTKWFLLLCLPLTAAIICTACNNAYAAAASDNGISYDNTVSEEEISSSAEAETTTTTTTIKEEPKPQPEPDYTITKAMYKYFDQFALVGDSVCSGFASAGYFKQENNLARPSIAAWNIHQFLITSNDLSTDVLVHLYNKQPKYVLFSMGLNDVNLTTKEQFVENYMQLLYQCKQASPNSEFIIMAITPVRRKFCKNEKIDEYNTALANAVKYSYCKHYHFVDPTDLLKGNDNKLREKYAFEDGTHLEMSGMKVCLWYMYNQNIRYDFTEDELKEPRCPDISQYEYLY